MIVKGRTTRQGLRDLNHYGPKRVKDGAVKDGAEAPPTGAVAEAATGPEAAAPVAPPVEAHDEVALPK